jgi:hypothetical protein
MAKPYNQAAAGRILRNRPRTPEEVLPGEPSAAARRGAQAGVMADIPGGLVDLARGGLGYVAAGLESLLPPEVAEGLNVSGFRRYMLPYSEEEKRQARAQFGAAPFGSSERIEEELVRSGVLPPSTGTLEETMARMGAGFMDAVPGMAGTTGRKLVGQKLGKTAAEAKNADFTAPMPKPEKYTEVTPDEIDKVIDDTPIIDPKDLIGKKVFPIVADLTDAGVFYSGIDSSKVDPQLLMGGPKYPNLTSSKAAGSVWAVQGKSVARKKLEKDADYAIVVAMKPTSHISNPQVANAIVNTNVAYARDGKISPENLQGLNSLIQEKYPDFPGLESPNVDAYLSKGEQSFETRADIGKILSQAKAESFGAANVDRILRATQDPETYSLRRNDAIFVVQIDKTEDPKDMSNLIELGVVQGTKEHPSYTYGIKGRVVGKFAAPVGWDVIWSDWLDQKKQEGVTGLIRSFDLNLPVTTITPEKAQNIANQTFKYIQGPRQLEVASRAVAGKWADSNTPVGQGGATPAGFARALRSSDAAPTLTQYSKEELSKAVRSGEMTLYQLGGPRSIKGQDNPDSAEIYFALKRNTDYNSDFDLEIPELTPNEVALVSVVNNEPGAKGIGGPGVVLKAIEEGATALDAFAVPSKKFPNGFLPELYSEFGFDEVARIKFNKEYYIKDNGAPAFEDLLDYWRSTGWDESQGMPDIVIMKYRGDDASRQGATQRFLTEGRVNPRGGTLSTVAPARENSGQRPGADILPAQPAGGPDYPGGDQGRPGAGDRTPLSNRFAGVIEEVANLSPQQAQSMGVDPDAYQIMRDIARKRAASQMVSTP